MNNYRPERGFLHHHPGQESIKEIQDNHVIVDVEDWEKARKYPEMLEALKGIYAIKELLFYPSEVKEEHLGEAIAVSEAIKKIESLINELKS